MLSNSCEYGLRATLYLASLERDGFVPISEISETLGIPFHFLTKIFQKLSQVDLLKSHRGPKGGVKLVPDPKDVTLEMIVVAIDGPGLFEECILGLPGCGNQKPCPLHEQWATERSRIQQLLANTNLATMAEGVSGADFRLSTLTSVTD